MPTLEEIKAKQQVAWTSGNYGRIAWITVPLAERLVEAVDLQAGSKVLDVATGTGHVALCTARRFCDTTGLDYAPNLLEQARQRAAAEDLDVEWVEGDAENMQFPDDTFDYTLSAIGAMFAPDQPKVADELVRVTKPGGTIGMVNWTPTGFLGELFKIIGKHVPPPPELKPPATWGDEDHVRGLFGDKVSSLTVEPGIVKLSFLTPEHFAEFFIDYYGPTHKAHESLEGEKKDAFRADIVELAKKFNRSSEAVGLQGDYIVVVAKK
jgi:ubiquinone/menaquinone biosynthesis C-methylase UbiE